ncbi:MAG: metalloregulator ArsR/SmtB family transcription factor [bacterium]|nr:metalloregulator ArsR/SmtB family transcription factor [bacterium]
MGVLERNEQLDVCGFLHVHEDKVAQVRSMLPDDDTLLRLSELFKVFGDSTRIRILYALFESEVCVCDIARLLGMTQSAVSHQLRILKQAHLITCRREGKTVFYSLADDHVATLLRQGTEHIQEE